jgi:HK97 family phage prohead protease
MNMELRFNNVEFKAEDGGILKVSGYVNKTEQLSEVLGYSQRFKEKIKKGCFARALKKATWDISFLDGHDDSKILASTRNNSLILREDEIGLYMEAEICPTSYGTDAYTLIKSGILRNMSFGFTVIKDSWKNITAGLFERTVEEMELYEVSVVREPAYSQSTIAARGINVIEDVAIPDDVIQEGELMEELRKTIESLKEELGSMKNEISELRTSYESLKEIRQEEKKPEENPEGLENKEEKPEEKPEQTEEKRNEEMKNEKPEEPEVKNEENKEQEEVNHDEIMAELDGYKAILAELKQNKEE